ncbi:hypothetical protein [Streptomyces roseolilacinus]|uniref:Uncharacterized protein n=1 Tax=Streptomyces roseolilacinus TaxID=66904 RepID=A0A918B258_9ACTN|nr:hypothetical protein [Streptomyces roseolilacinus]GGQ08429.1 hypothetical protein GCM10010249_28550 [Streptomyces roseolilacinus]
MEPADSGETMDVSGTWYVARLLDILSFEAAAYGRACPVVISLRDGDGKTTFRKVANASFIEADGLPSPCIQISDH